MSQYGFCFWVYIFSRILTGLMVFLATLHFKHMVEFHRIKQKPSTHAIWIDDCEESQHISLLRPYSPRIQEAIHSLPRKLAILVSIQYKSVFCLPTIQIFLICNSSFRICVFDRFCWLPSYHTSLHETRHHNTS